MKSILQRPKNYLLGIAALLLFSVMSFFSGSGTGQKYLKNKMPIVFGSMERTAYLGTIIFQPMGAG